MAKTKQIRVPVEEEVWEAAMAKAKRLREPLAFFGRQWLREWLGDEYPDEIERGVKRALPQSGNKKVALATGVERRHKV